jgi:N-acetyl-anhydromuramyl-L-alanine amidase AmpD
MSDYAAATWAASSNFWAGRRGHALTGIVLHGTAGLMPGPLAWFQNRASQVSAHYIVCITGQVYQCVREKDSAWHAGEVTPDSAFSGGPNPNLWTLGVEHERDVTNSLPLPAVQVDASIQLLRDIMVRHGPLTLYTHDQFAVGRICPGPNFPLQDITAALSAPSAVPQKESTMVQHLDRPFAGMYPVTQEFGVQNPMEPLGDKYTDGGVGYIWKQGAIAGHWHNGTDYATPCGTPLLSCAAGTVTFAGWDATGFGNRVSVDHGNGLQTLVGHLQQIDVHVGQHVTTGQRLGLSGTTGNSTGCHTHWSVQQGDEYVSPVPYLNAPMPATGHPPKSAAEAVEVLARHAADLQVHPSVPDTNQLISDMCTKWPKFTS